MTTLAPATTPLPAGVNLIGTLAATVRALTSTPAGVEQPDSPADGVTR